MNRECLYIQCRYHFDGTDEHYEKCPKCGAGSVRFTEPVMRKDNPEIVDSDIPFGYIVNEDSLKNISKCKLASECYFHENYKPSCEELTFTPECLTPVYEELYRVHSKLDKVLSLLEQTHPVNRVH